MKACTVRNAAALLALAGGLASLTACSDPRPAPATTTTTAGAATPGGEALPEVLATVGGEPITMAEVRAEAGEELAKLEATYQRAHTNLLDGALKRILRERVVMAEAERRGRTLDQLVLDEAGGTLEPNEIEISAWYEDNRGRVGGRSLDQVRGQIADLLRNRRRQQAMEQLEARLNEERDVKVFLEPWRFQFDNRGAPSAGNPEAKVTLVEFSDFQCPFCARFVPTLNQLKAEYGDRVNIVYRQYPIPNLHPHAIKAAEASLCANEQGRFWELHDRMFQQQDRLTVREIKLLAGEIGLDQQAFDACLDSGKFAEQVQNDMAEGQRAGINGTPALFVNGVEIPGGAVPYEMVAAALDRELARR